MEADQQQNNNTLTETKKEEIVELQHTIKEEKPPIKKNVPAGKAQGEKKVANKGKLGRSKFNIETESVVGTRDFPPPDMRVRNWLFNHFKAVASEFAFQEYDTPVLEFAELYQRKAGEEITGQMYHFKDKDDYHLALRPELTPSLARLILKAGRKQLFPIRWFSIAQCWRHEDIKRGRKREHYQWNMDIWGVNKISAELELLCSVVTFFKRVGLTSRDVGIKINSRKVLNEVLEPLGVKGDKFAPVCVIIDKLDKLEPEEVQKQLETFGISLEIIETITKTLALKDIQALRDALPNSQVVKEFEELFTLARAYGIDDWLIFDASVVRGLAYYTGIVFEAFDRGGTMRAICGGGRYDKLLSIYGAKEDTPACGFGFGDCVIIELLKDKGLLPQLDPEVDDIVIPFDETLRPVACQVASKLRAKGRRVDLQLTNKRLKDIYSYADRVCAQRAVLIAPDEWAQRLVRIKYLREGDKDNTREENIKFEDL